MKTDLEKKSYSIVSFGYHANRIMKKWENSFPTFSSENLPYNYIILTDDADTYASVIDEKLKGYNSLFQSEGVSKCTHPLFMHKAPTFSSQGFAIS